MRWRSQQGPITASLSTQIASPSAPLLFALIARRPELLLRARTCQEVTTTTPSWWALPVLRSSLFGSVLHPPSTLPELQERYGPPSATERRLPPSSAATTACLQSPRRCYLAWLSFNRRDVARPLRPTMLMHEVWTLLPWGHWRATTARAIAQPPTQWSPPVHVAPRPAGMGQHDHYGLWARLVA
jgi:hypothetical protein